MDKKITENSGVEQQNRVIRCRKCKEEKRDTEFHNNKGTKTGKDLFCKPCRNESNAKSKKLASAKKDEKLKKYLTYKLALIVEQDRKRFPDYTSTLTVDDLYDIYYIYKGRCIYSRKLLKPGNKINIYAKISYDRINNDLPHTRDNLQLTSVFMNMMRSDRSRESFEKFIAEFD